MTDPCKDARGAMQIDFVKLWREAKAAYYTGPRVVHEESGSMVRMGDSEAAARVLEAAFAAAVEEERAKAGTFKMSRLTNCYIDPRNVEETLFSDGGGVHVNLDGYAIVPVEKWESLKDERARIVAWARDEDAKRPRDNWFAHVARLIEQGEHDNATAIRARSDGGAE